MQIKIGQWRTDSWSIDPSRRFADVIIDERISSEWSLSTLGLYWHVLRNGHHVSMTEINDLARIGEIIRGA